MANPKFWDKDALYDEAAGLVSVTRDETTEEVTSRTVNTSNPAIASLFGSENTSLMTTVCYGRNADSLKDRAFNTITLDGTTWDLDTALANVAASVSGAPRDIVAVVTATAATSVTFTSGLLKGDTPTFSEAGTWLVTFTEYASGVWYCRQIAMEDAA